MTQGARPRAAFSSKNMNNSIFPVGWLLCAALAVPPAAAQSKAPEPVSPPKTPQTLPVPLPGDRMQVTIHRLPNGLTVYLSPNRQEPRVTAWTAVRAGGKHDPDDSTGMAHYLEHMLFKGSSRMGTLDFDKEKVHLDRILELYEELFKTQDPEKRKEVYAKIDEQNVQAGQYAIPNELDKLYKSLGFDGINAFTSDEQTVYTCDFPANRAEVWARAEADRFARPVFRLFQTEIETVYEEKNRSLDNASRILHEALGKLVYKEHPYGQRTVLGSIEHLKNPSLAKMYAYYDAFYRPNNMALALSGDFERESMLALIEKHFGAWEPKALPPAREWALPKLQGVERVEVKYEAEEQVQIGWHTVPASHPDAEALTVMDMVLDNSEAGILNLDLNQGQKVKNSGSYPRMQNDAGAWYLWAVPKKDQTLEQAEALLLETVEKLRAGDFSEEDVRAVITDFEVTEKLRLEQNQARVSVMVDSFIEFEEWSHTVGRLDRLRKVTKEDVVRVARTYLGPNRAVAYRRLGKPEIPSIQKPSFTKIPIDPKRQSPFFAELAAIPAKPLEPRWIAEGQDYLVLQQPWGKLYSTKNPMNDLFAVSFSFDRGRRHARQLCAALDLLELSGAGELSAEAFKRKLYGLGTKMGVSCGEDGAGVSLSGLDANFEESLRMMFRRFEAPHVATDTLKKMVEVQIGAHQDNKKDPGYVGYALREYASRGPKSEVLNQLTDAELRALKEGGLKTLIRSVFDYKRKAAYVGVRDPGAVAPLLAGGRKAFKPEPPREPRRYVRAQSPRVIFTNRDMVQSRVGIFAADTVYDPKEAVDYLFYNEYMGGMSGVIFQEVREARALAYSAGGGYSTGGRKGDENTLTGWAGCQADKTVETAALMRDLLKKMPPSQERFLETSRAIEEQFRSDVITFRRIPGAVIHWEELGLPPGDPRPERFRRALAYTQDDLKRFARRFEGKTLIISVLGHKDRIDLKGLKGLGAWEERPIDSLFPY